MLCYLGGQSLTQKALIAENRQKECRKGNSRDSKCEDLVASSEMGGPQARLWIREKLLGAKCGPRWKVLNLNEFGSRFSP